MRQITYNHNAAHSSSPKLELTGYHSPVVCTSAVPTDDGRSQRRQGLNQRTQQQLGFSHEHSTNPAHLPLPSFLAHLSLVFLGPTPILSDSAPCVAFASSAARRLHLPVRPPSQHSRDLEAAWARIPLTNDAGSDAMA